MTLPQRRGQIVREAMDLFARHGFAGTTTQKIAQRAGVSEALLFRIFRNKRSLYSAIIDLKISETGEDLFPHEAAARNDDQAVFNTIATVMLASMERDPSFMRLMLYSGLERHQLAEMVYEARVVKLFSFLEGYIRKRIRQKAFRPVRADVVARTFVGMSVYHMLNSKIFGYQASRHLDIEQVAESFVDLTLQGLKR
jgi:AcrR family transcriptional regulator